MRPDIEAVLAEIDAQVERVALNNPEGSDVSVLAYAVHNLIECVRDLHPPT